MRRRLITLSMVAAGFALQAVAYLLLAAPIGSPDDPRISSPRMPFAPMVFIAGVMLVFLAAVAYELLPDREEEHQR
jgi:hypothetical protein